MTDALPGKSWASTDRRGFLAGCAGCALALAAGPRALAATSEGGRLDVARGFVRPHKSDWFLPTGDGGIVCTLCPRACIVPDGERGHCDVRENRGGEYYSMVYGNPCAVHADPVEKKPFFHVLPGTDSFSIATAGCNLDCKFCQNWEISQTVPELSFNYDLSPELVVELAAQANCATIASTYVEPTIFFEYMLDIALAAKKRGILKVMHSNGFIAPAPQKALIPHLAAACIDLKGIAEDYYREMCGGRLAPIQEALKLYKEHGVHTELVTLVVPGFNDAPQHLRTLCDWVVESLGPDTPIHFSRFSPMYKLTNVRRTPTETLEQARSIAMEAGVRYAYIGNVPGNDGENTYCPACKKLLISRRGYKTQVEGLDLAAGACSHCQEPIAGIWTNEVS